MLSGDAPRTHGELSHSHRIFGQIAQSEGRAANAGPQDTLADCANRVAASAIKLTRREVPRCVGIEGEAAQTSGPVRIAH
jgi:hypothetical protein